MILYLLNTDVEKGILVYLEPCGLSALNLRISNAIIKLVFFKLGLILELIFFCIFVYVFFNIYTYLFH